MNAIATLEILRPGFFSTVQDLGRTGWRASGIGQSGAADPWALRLVNTLLGNPTDAAAIEITFGSFALRFLRDTVFALGGADAQARLDGARLGNWWVRSARAGQVLRLGNVSAGVRSYLGVAGGLAVPLVMGARATDLKGGFGGLDGRLLKTGDVLDALACPDQPRAYTSGFGLAADKFPLYPEWLGGTPVLDFLPAVAWDDYSPAAQAALTGTDWTVSRQSNRIGVLLEGPALRARQRPEQHSQHAQHSHGIVPGVIQMPPSARPMVQLCDGNTCGGYPIIGTVISAHLHLLGQLPPGAPLRLRRTHLEAALRAQAAQTAVLAEVHELAGAARARLGWG